MCKRQRKRFIEFSVFILILGLWSASASAAPLPGGTLDPAAVPKYTTPLVIPPAMPKTSTLLSQGKPIDYYEIAVRQFQQQILPPGYNPTTVWSYGSANHPGTFNYPSFTIEARVNRPVRVKWINDLVDAGGNYLPHLLPIDQTLHWANPGREMCVDHMGNPAMPGTDCRTANPQPYTGPVPIITHVHGAHAGPESDGHPEAWYLPAANNIPAGYADQGSRFDQIPGVPVQPGAAVFQYPNDQHATTLWYHDHSLGMTRANVYAGPAGFYLLRGGLSDLQSFFLPRPAPALGDPPGKKYYEIPIAIQDRSFNADGSLFYADSRAFFDGFFGPYIGDLFSMSDISPIWNPEFFGNTMVVNGKTWPNLNVEQRKYRFRLLNGSNSRFLLLKLANAGDEAAPRPAAPAASFWQVGAEGGFLPSAVGLPQLLMGPAERADVVVDFSKFPVGATLYLINEGPDAPFGGGVPFSGCLTDPNAPAGCFDPADPGTTGQVMKFTVVARTSFDFSIHPSRLPFPRAANLGTPAVTRKLSLNEDMSSMVCVDINNSAVPCSSPDSVGFAGPIGAKLGILDPVTGAAIPKKWSDVITENPSLNATEVWEIHNFTADAHPIHLHQVMFQVIERQDAFGAIRGPELWEKGLKDTVIAYPGEITRIKAKFDIPGLYVWHCHIVEHEDNEMMRPYCVGTPGVDCPIDLFSPIP